MSKKFWIDSQTNQIVSYDTLFAELLKEGDNNVYIYSKNPVEVFLNLLRNLLCEKKSIILDGDFSSYELDLIGISKNHIEDGIYFQDILVKKYKSFDEIISFLISKSDLLSIELYTSGTTGRPKKISQYLTNVIRAVKTTESMKNKIWGFAYNPTHFAGLQVFFQAFFNLNPMVFLFDKNYDTIYKDLCDHSITNLSSTPTFMKMLIPSIKEPLVKVKKLTFGGEKFNTKLSQVVKEKFPNAKIRNIYASTEAGSLLIADNEGFSIPERYEKLIKIEDGELLIHKKLLGTSNSLKLKNSYYRTGDLVEFIEDKKFRFLNRKSEMINVGGYKVNPHEIEEVIININGIKDVIVFGRKNSLLGNVIIANVIKTKVKDELELQNLIKKTIKDKLQDYKVPQKINFVDSFGLSRTGKVEKI